MNKRLLIHIVISLALLSVPCSAQEKGSIARSASFGDMKDRLSEVTGGKSSPPQTGYEAQRFIEMAKKLISEEKFSQAKEALKTAIRLEPMNPEAWEIYDLAVLGENMAANKKARVDSETAQDNSSLFEITRVDTYVELDTLYVVGSLTNLSAKLKQKIKVTAIILDKQKKELRRQTGNLKLAEKGLMPNESSLFEIPFKSPPVDSSTFKVQVTSFE